MRWHCPSDTGFEIRALAVWGRACYLWVTEAFHNTEFHTWMGKKHVCFFQTAETGKRTPNSSVKGSGANHYPRAPAWFFTILTRSRTLQLHLTLTLTARGQTLSSESDVCRRQILTTKDYPRTVKVKIFLMVLHPYHRYSNESERANWDDFKLIKPFGCDVFHKLIQRFKG